MASKTAPRSKAGCALAVAAAVVGGVALVLLARYLIPRTSEDTLFALAFVLAMTAIAAVTGFLTRRLVGTSPAEAEPAAAEDRRQKTPKSSGRSGPTDHDRSRPSQELPEELPELSPLRVLDVFVVGRVTEPVRISEQSPLVGELRRDREGDYFLSPEEDERGEGMGSIFLPDLSDGDVVEWVGRLVEVSGVLDPSSGLTVETLRLR